MDNIQTVSIKLVKESTAKYETNRVSSPTSAYDIAKQFLQDVDREHFIVMCLDTKNKVNAINTVSIGSINATTLHPREVFKPAILSNSASIIVAHNHPSGDAEPSPEDVHMTKRLVEVGELMGIPCLDHIVIGDGYFVSLKQRGQM